MKNAHFFDEETTALLNQGQEALSSQVNNGHCALYGCLREAIGRITTVDAFLVALFRDENHVLYAYQYDGKIFAPPGVRPIDPKGPTGWVSRHRRTYEYSLDNGAALNHGISWGDSQRRSADAVFVPMRRRNGHDLLGLVSIQTYQPNTYDETTVAAFEWLVELLARILSGEDEQRNHVRSLDHGVRSPGRTSSQSITELVIGRLDKIRALAENLARATGNEAHVQDEASHIVSQCERLQIDVAELNIHIHQDAAYHFSLLTPREREIVKLLTAGLTNNEIGQYLQISQSTVKTHMTNILRKYGAKRGETVGAQVRLYLGDIETPQMD